VGTGTQARHQIEAHAALLGPDQITVADLTGIAAKDIAMADVVLDAYGAVT